MTSRVHPPAVLLSVPFVMALALGACGGSVDDGGPAFTDAGEGGAPPPHAPQAGGSVGCVRPSGPFKNPAICPAHYWLRSSDRTCAPLGIRCVFPGEGDDCATAVMQCSEDARGDAGADGDAAGGRWIYGQ